MSASKRSQTAPDLMPLRLSLERTLRPKHVAVVGLSDRSAFRHLIDPLSTPDIEWSFVNARHDTVLGRATHNRLSATGKPIDAVISFLPAAPAVELIEEAASLDVGGVIIVAAGFGESGPAGRVLEERIAAIARPRGLAIIGPNSVGISNARRSLFLSIAGRHLRRPGGISLVSHSGALLSAAVMAAWEHERCGLNITVSAGNESATDMADYVDFLAEDQETTAIGLVIETIRRPDEFFAAIRRAIDQGKAVVALKLGRTERANRITTSHTGSLSGPSWAYDVALRQAGVALAYDPEELLDRLSLFDQIPPARRTAVKRLGMVSYSGGMASLCVDIAEKEGVELPALESFREWVDVTTQPGASANPLDIAGPGVSAWDAIVEKYIASDELDAMLILNPLAVGDEVTNGDKLAAVMRASDQVAKPVVLSNFSASPADWAMRGISENVGVGRGLRPSLRALQTLGATTQFAHAIETRPVRAARIARPSGPLVRLPDADLLAFDTAVDLLHGYGIPMAPYALVAEDAPPARVLETITPPFVAKLANVPHRTELDAVRLNVGAAELTAAVEELRGIARQAGQDCTVAVQPMVESVGELILGVDGTSELGPIVVVGMGGTDVELRREFAGRMAPVTPAQAWDMLGELPSSALMNGHRGSLPWDMPSLVEIIVRLGQLADAGRQWLHSLDINPLLYTGQGFCGVDAMILVQSDQDLSPRAPSRP